MYKINFLYCRIWSIGEKKQIKIMQDILPKSNDFSNSTTIASVAWKPEDNATKVLAVAHKTNVTLFQSKGSDSEWTNIKELKSRKVVLKADEYYSVVNFSKSENGSYLAAATTKGNIFVWHVTTGNIILETRSTSEHEYPICSIDFCPNNDSEAAFIDSNGYWGVVQDIPIQERGREGLEKQKQLAQKKIPPKKPEPERELNEDELAAALFEGEIYNLRVIYSSLIQNMPILK